MKKIYFLVLTLAFATLVQALPGLIQEPDVYTNIKTVVNNAPIAVDDINTVPKNQNATGNVLINDSDPEGDMLTVTEFEINSTVYQAGTAATLPGIGSVKIDEDGTYSFDFIKNYKGVVPEVSYIISDANGGTDIATLTVTISKANITPVAVNDSTTIDEDNVGTGNVLLNDTDPDGDDLTLTYFVVNSIETPAGSTAMLPGVGDLIIKTDGSYTFSPAQNYNGAIPVAIYSLTDGTDTISALLKITVNPINDAPVAENDTESTPKNVTATGNLLTNDSDLDGDVLTVTEFVIGATAYPTGTVAVLAGVGSVEIDIDGSYSFIPATDYTGAVPVVTYNESDGNGGTSSATITFTIINTNSAPVAINDTKTVNEDVNATGNVLTNDTDADGDILSVTQFEVNATTVAAGVSTTLPGVGSLIINTNGTYIFTPEANYNGSVPVATYTVSDGTASSTATLTITLVPVNDAPVAVNDMKTVNEDVNASGNVLINDTDVEADDLTVTQFVVNATTIPAGTSTAIAGVGSLIINANGTYTFTPLADYNGTVPAVTYTVSDGTATSTTTLNITVTAVNDLPVAVNDTKSTPKNVTATGNLLTNDSDVDGDVLAVTEFSIGILRFPPGIVAPMIGVGLVEIDADGSYSFIPSLNYTGAVPVVTYTVSDGNGGTSPGTISFTITNANSAPVATNDTNTVNEDTNATRNVLTNDTDADGNSLSVTQFVVNDNTVAADSSTTLPGVGSLIINTNGTYTFTPLLNYNGAVPVVTYTVSDGTATSTATLTITLVPVNDAPVAVNDTKTVNEDVNATGNVLTNDSDVEADDLTVNQFVVNATTTSAGTSTEIAGVGNLIINTNGTYTFTPLANYNGTVPAVTYTVSDGTSPSTATLTISVTPVNDAPVAVNDTKTVNEDVSATGNVLSNDSDVEADDLTVTQFVVNATTIPAGTSTAIAGVGSLIIDANGTYTFIPLANYNGAVPVATYTVSDGTAISTTTLKITVTAVNDVPIAVNDTKSTPKNVTATGNLLTNDSDVDGDVLTVTEFVIGATTYPAGTVAVLAGVGSVEIDEDGAYSFIPATDYIGAVPVITYTASDEKGETSSATITFTIINTNDAPVAINDTKTVNEDVNATGNVLTNDTDADGDVLSVTQFVVNATTVVAGTSTTLAGAGSLIINTNGTYTFTPEANYNGSVAVANYTVSDGTASSTATLTISVTPVNDAPVAVNDTKTVIEDVNATGNVLTNDTDDDGDVLSVTQFVVNATTVASGTSTTLTGTGSLIINANGTYTFTPAANFNGAVPLITYTVSDGPLTSSSTLTITITPVNDAPVAVNDSKSTPKNVAATGNLLTNDSDVDGDVLSVTQFIISGTTHPAGTIAALTGIGSVQINVDGAFSFIPANNYVGAVPIVSYTVSDGKGGSTAGTITFSISNTNAPPIATNDSKSVNEDNIASGNVLTNDTDADGDVVTVTQFVVNATLVPPGSSATMTGIGILVINTNGTYTFTPAANYNGTVPVATYTVTDGTVTATSSLTITVTPVNDAPVAVNDTKTVNEDINATGNVLSNDSDIEGSLLSVTQFVVNTTTVLAGNTAILTGIGNLIVYTNGTYTFSPAPNFNGEVPAATYTVSDGTTTSTATLTITLTPINDAPTAVNDVKTVLEDNNAFGNILLNDSDIEGSTLSVTQFVVNATTVLAGSTATLPGIGTLIMNADGTFVFTPVANYNGPVPVVTYTISDGAASSTATLSITVIPVNNAPVAINDTKSVNEDNNASGNVITNDSDFDGNILTVTQFVTNTTTVTAGNTATLPGVGTLVINADGTYIFTPVANYNGAVPIATYTISDGELTSTATLTLTVNPVNDPPVAVNDIKTVNENNNATGNVLANDSDIEGATLTVTQFVVNTSTSLAGNSLTLAGIGSLVINANGSYVFSPIVNYYGPVPVATYTISDGTITSSATLTITVSPVNDPPVAVNDTRLVNEDNIASGNVITNDTDVDGGILSVTQFVASSTTYTAGNTATLAGIGTLIINIDGTYTFSPLANYNGPAPVVTYTVSDGISSSSATLTITITSVNDAPVAVNDNRSTPKNITATGNLIANDTDVDGDVLRVTQFEIDGTIYSTGISAILSGIGTIIINANGSYSFVPANNYTGLVPIVNYTISDGNGRLSSGKITITISDTNAAPKAVNDSQTINEDVKAIGNLIANDIDADGNILLVTKFVVNATTVISGNATTIPGVGTLLINADGSYSFTPLANYNGTVPTVTYTVSDGLETASAILTIIVSPVNDAPITVNDSKAGIEDVFITGNVLTNDSDIEGSLLSITQFIVNATTILAGSTATIPGIGTLVIKADGSYNFTPAKDFNGNVPTVIYTVTDGQAFSTATLSMIITPVNDAPIAVADVKSGIENTSITGNVLDNDTDADGDALTLTQYVVNSVPTTAGSSATIAGAGVLVINANGTYSFTPVKNYNGSVPVVTYTITDGTLTATSTLTIVISQVNESPVAVSDTKSINEDNVGTGNVILNDTDGDADLLTVTKYIVNAITITAGNSISITGTGTLLINPDGTYTFTPIANFNGSVPEVNYTITDGKATSNATLGIIVVPVNDLPVAVNDSLTTNEEVNGSGNLISNDSDVDRDVLSITQYTVNSKAVNAGVSTLLPGIGTLLINSDGLYFFSPVLNFSGTVPAITYTLSDGTATSSGSLKIKIKPLNDLPQAVNDFKAGNEDSNLTGNVLANDTDVDGDLLTTTQAIVNGLPVTSGNIAAMPGIGTFILNTDGSYIFTPIANYHGTVPDIVYTVTDGTSSVTAILTITVNPVNDSPVGINDNKSTPVNTVATGNVLLNDKDIDGDILKVTQFTVNAPITAGNTATIKDVGTLLINADGSFVFTPVDNFSGMVPVAIYTLSDGSLNATATLTILISNSNSAPVSVNDTVTINEDENASGNLITNDLDVDGDVLSISTFEVNGNKLNAGSAAIIPGVGSLIINEDGTYTFTPIPNFNGNVPLATYVLSDGIESSSAFLIIKIISVNDAPVAVNDNILISEDSIARGNVLFNDSDPEGSILTVTKYVVNNVTANAGTSTIIPVVGSITINQDGTYIFTPDPDYAGLVPQIIYTISDGAATSSANLSIIINSVNDAPVAINDTLNVTEDNSGSGNLILNDFDAEGNLAITEYLVNNIISMAGQPVFINGKGTLIINSIGTFEFTPVLNYNGTFPTLTYKVSDGTSSVTALLIINVSPANDGPLAVNDSKTGLKNTNVSGNVITNDTDVDGDKLTVTQFLVNGSTITSGNETTITGFGNLIINSDGTYLFTPSSGFIGIVPPVFYTISDDLALATASLTIEIVNSGLTVVAVNDSINTLEDNIISGNVLTNDLGTSLLVTALVVNGNNLIVGQAFDLAGTGMLTLNSDGTFNFNPTANYNGTGPLVIYTISDSTKSSSATLKITVLPVNDSPIAVNDIKTVTENSDATGNVLQNDRDPDGDALIVTNFEINGRTYSPDSIVSISPAGTFMLNLNGFFTFKPIPDYTGLVPTVTYTITDGISTTSATLTIIINPTQVGGYKIRVPQGISPNGDGINDVLKIDDIEFFPSNEISIFNRWGNKVFEAKNYQNNWDGKNYLGVSIGTDLPVGTYFYVLDLGEGSKAMQGYIYINR